MSAATSLLLAVRQVLPDESRAYPLHEPIFEGRETEYVNDCVVSGWVSSVGSYVDRFERDLAAYTGAKAAVAVANGTAALHMALLVAGVQQDDEVLVPALTFVATANAVVHAGGIPHFVDCEAHCFGVDAHKLDDYLCEVCVAEGGVCRNRNSGRVVRALIIMHAFGHPSDLDALAEVCAKHALILVEDAAESLGSFYHDTHTGRKGLVASLSFNGNKIITTGGGGAILTDDAELARRAKHVSTTAKLPHAWRYTHDEVAYNYRMPNLNAALGCAQLERLESFVARKRSLAMRYQKALEGIAGLRFVAEPPGARSNYWLNTVLLDNGGQLEDVLSTLQSARILARPAWDLMHTLPMYSRSPRADLSCAEDLARRIVNLPSSVSLQPSS